MLEAEEKLTTQTHTVCELGYVNADALKVGSLVDLTVLRRSSASHLGHAFRVSACEWIGCLNSLA